MKEMSFMSENFLPFSKPIISQETIDEVISCLKSGWLATGPRVQKFEEDLRHYFQRKYAPVLTSATAGLFLTLKSMGIGEGDEVITTPMTFVASLNTIVHVGAKPVLVDVDVKTYNIDVNLIESAITPRTKAIMPVHFTGLPVDLDPIYKLAERYGLRVIEDAAQAMGSWYKGKLIGSFGDCQVFSFHPNKVMTSGEGGCITTNDDALAKKIGVMRFHGIDREAWNRYGKGGSQHYEVVDAGYKYNMLDLQAAIGIHQLRELPGFLVEREKLAKRYNELFAGRSELTLPGKPNYDHKHCWYIYAPLINPESAGLTRDEFMQRMQEHNVGTGYHYCAAHLFSFYQNKFGYKTGQFPNAETISDRIVSLPLFPTMTEAEQDRVVEAMFKIFKR
jgi:dTDP-4-amino-4,6-dideoxygalactose transaminase